VNYENEVKYVNYLHHVKYVLDVNISGYEYMVIFFKWWCGCNLV